MMELQGALGLAQLRKLPDMIARQRENKGRLKTILSGLKGISFRHLPDPEGDTATFLAFFLPDPEKAMAFKELAGKGGVGWFIFSRTPGITTATGNICWDESPPAKTAGLFGQLTGADLKYPPDALPSVRCPDGPDPGAAH